MQKRPKFLATNRTASIISNLLKARFDFSVLRLNSFFLLSMPRLVIRPHSSPVLEAATAIDTIGSIKKVKTGPQYVPDATHYVSRSRVCPSEVFFTQVPYEFCRCHCHCLLMLTHACQIRRQAFASQVSVEYREYEVLVAQSQLAAGF